MIETTVTLAEQLRGTGNSRFALGNVIAARKDYEESLDLLNMPALLIAQESSPELLQRVKTCRLAAQLNVALCCLKTEPRDAHRARQLCDAVLEADPGNAKAVYRKAKALMELQELSDAEPQLVLACSLAPGDVAPRNDLLSVRAQLKAKHKASIMTSNPESDIAGKNNGMALKPVVNEGGDGMVTKSRSSLIEDEVIASPDSSEIDEAAARFPEAQDEFRELLRRADAGDDFDELDGEENSGDVWARVEENYERVCKATERHADLWKEVQACLQERDSWESKLRQMQKSASEATSLETQIKVKNLRGNAATTKSKEYAAAARAYSVTERRVKKLDMQVLKLLREIRSIEQDPQVVIDPANRLNDAMRDAVMQDDPSKLQDLLSSLPNRIGSQRAEDIIQRRPELAIKDLQSRIKECKQHIAAQSKTKCCS